MSIIHAMGVRTSSQIYERNLRIFPFLEIFRGLLFFIPVWVSYELQYITLGQLAFLEAIIMGTQLLLELPTGALADLIGKKKTVILGNVMYCVSLILYAVSRDYSAFILYALANGIASALISGAYEALLYDTLKENGKEHEFSGVNSKLNLITQISIASSILLGGIIGSFGYIYAIWATAVSAFFCFLTSFFLIEPFIDTEKFTVRRYVHQTTEGFHELFKTEYIKRISLFYILVGGITWVFNLVFNVPLITEQGFSTLQIGIIFASIRVVNGFVLFKGLRIGTLFTKRRIFFILPIIMAVSLLPGIFLTKWTAIISVMGILFCSTSRWVILSEYTNNEFASKNRATAISTLSMAVGIIYVIASLAAGPIMQWYGSVKIIYSLLGVFTVVTIIPLGLSLSREHKIIDNSKMI